MPICGYSVLLTERDEPAQRALELMQSDRRLEIGIRAGRRVAVVGETDSPDDDRRLWNWLNEQPGIAHVDVVFVHFDESAEPITPQMPVESERGVS